MLAVTLGVVADLAVGVSAPAAQQPLAELGAAVILAQGEPKERRQVLDPLRRHQPLWSALGLHGSRHRAPAVELSRRGAGAGP